MSIEPDAAPNADESSPGESQRPSHPTASAGSGRRLSQEFRQELLRRLPKLPSPRWQASETLDVYKELSGIVDLDADAFLKPLEQIAEERHE